MAIPFPSACGLNEQTNIVKQLDEIQMSITLEESDRLSTDSKIDAILPSVLNQVFDGEKGERHP